ncbi:MAG TPA: penicillin acylase family protein [Isosphaeraceae bacterium]|nr:penicillin acylase family protein [Isosphaeraceae bacterium]
MNKNAASQEILARLGRGESIAAVCAWAGLSRQAFDAWWQAEIARRVPAMEGVRTAAVRGPVRIDRDAVGIPHIRAANDVDLFFGFGYAMAADRLFQMDYLRRKGRGRLAEVLGPEALELDRLARTVGLGSIAEAEWMRLDEETRRLVDAFAAGVNALREQTREHPPIEFDLLGFRPEPWSPVDCLVIECEFRWYLTGRFPVIVMPELARRALGDGPLYRAFLHRESDAESIVPPDWDSTATAAAPCGPIGAGTAAGDPDAAQGSNNWVLAGSRTRTGHPIVASDPHIAFEAVSCWYPVRLDGGSFQVAGMTYVGMPAVLFGRNRHVAWGCTNNICSLRDLYQERTDPAHPGCFLHDGRWEPARTAEEVIQVKGQEPLRLAVVHSRNGPIVDAVLPAPARGTGPVSLKWLGADQGGWLTALLAMDRAHDAAGFREATRPWHVPTFTVVFADDQGHIGVQITGRVPLRREPERGYRPGWDPAHQWQGLIPFEGMPHALNPPRGWLASANNRPVSDDYPYHLAGTWNDDLRARRIRQRIEAAPRHARADVMAMHYDTRSLRAEAVLPRLLDVLSDPRSWPAGVGKESRATQALAALRAWDLRVEPDRVAATLFNVFFASWIRTVVEVRFEGATAELLAGGAAGLASALLDTNLAGWFADEPTRRRAIAATFAAALDGLEQRLGPDVLSWTWGRLHRLELRHALSGRGELGTLLDHGGVPVGGDLTTVCNTGQGPGFEARTGAGFRMVAELDPQEPGLWLLDAQSQSGHPGSPHYADQLPAWLAGQYHLVPLDRPAAARASLRLVPL